MMYRKLAMLLVVCTGLGGCQLQGHDGSEHAKEARAQQEHKISKLQNELFNLKSKLSTLEAREKFDSGWLSSLSNQVESHISATFDPATSSGYQYLNAGPVSLMLSIKDIKAYGAGTKIYVRIGNPSTAVLYGLDGVVSYGPSYSKEKTMGYLKWLKAQNSVHQSIPDTFYAGRWKTVSIILSNVKPDSLGRLNFTLHANKIAFSGR